MDEKINKLREAGFSDADIAEWKKQQADAGLAPIAPGEVSEESVPFVVTPTTPVPEPSTATNAAEALAVANQALSSPVAHAIEGTAATLYAGKKAVDIAKAMRAPAPVVNVHNYPLGGMQGVPEMARAPIAPQAPPPVPKAPPIGGPAAAQGSDFIQSITQKYGQVGSALGKVARVAGPLAMAGTMAYDMLATSPEDIAKLKRQEAEARARGWKPINER